MKPRPFLNIFFIFLAVITLLSACKDFIQPSLSKRQAQLEAPVDQYQSKSDTISFWWDEVSDATKYHLQVVTPDFIAPGGLVLDTVVAANKFKFAFNSGKYQWRVKALNNSSQTVFSAPWTFVTQ